MKKVLRVKVKGYNAYYRYTEHFLHNALQSFGYNLTRDEKTADFAVTAYINPDAEYFSLTSTFFDQLQGEEQEKLCNAISKAMKSEVLVCPWSEDAVEHLSSEFRFLYSSTSNAYDEPALIEKGDSNLKYEGYSYEMENRGHFTLDVVNYGGPTRGLDVIIEAPLWAMPFLSVESAQIHWYTKEGYRQTDMVFKKKANRLACKLKDFEILSGRNEMSALWCRSRTKYQSVKFYVDFKLKYIFPIQPEIIITVKPFFGKGVTIKYNLQ